MDDDTVTVFFYGLFMDESLLSSKGIHPARSAVGFVDGYRLRIGERATLVPSRTGRAYGVLMTIGRQDVRGLYSDVSVADYVAEPVSVTLPNGNREPAVCYNLPASKLAGANSAYAETLLDLAGKLGFPDEYLDTIRTEADRDQAAPP